MVTDPARRICPKTTLNAEISIGFAENHCCAEGAICYTAQWCL
jgi:hypothetical protein